MTELHVRPTGYFLSEDIQYYVAVFSNNPLKEHKRETMMLNIYKTGVWCAIKLGTRANSIRLENNCVLTSLLPPLPPTKDQIRGRKINYKSYRKTATNFFSKTRTILSFRSILELHGAASRQSLSCCVLQTV